jgi:ubiquinone/menaquinone biosynthesis C-methylase UbiE
VGIHAIPVAAALQPDGVLDVPDATTALRELRRVLKSDARLLVREVFLDPDFISASDLHARARDAGFVIDRRSGPRVAYTAVFRPTTVAG